MYSIVTKFDFSLIGKITDDCWDVGYNNPGFKNHLSFIYRNNKTYSWGSFRYFKSVFIYNTGSGNFTYNKEFRMRK